MIGRDAVTVQAERDTAVGLDHVIRRKVGGQVISSRRKRIVAVAAHSPFDVVNIQCAAYLLDLLGKGGLAAFSCMAAAVAGVAPAEVVGVPITQLNLSTRQLKPFAANIGNEVIGGAFAAHFGIPAGGKRLIAIISVQRHTELCTVGQAAFADGDGLAIRQVDIVGRVLCSAHGIIGDGHFAADFEGAAAHIHAAASGGVVAGDGGGVFHSEIAAAHIHAAAIAIVVGVVAGDAATEHIEGAGTHIHAASSVGVVAGDAAAVHIEGASVHIHASAGIAACMGDLTGILAVGKGEATAGQFDGIHSVCTRDFVPV